MFVRWAAPGGAFAAAPMNTWRTAGPAATPVDHLNWGLSAISVVVLAVVAALVLWGIVRRRPGLVPDALGRLPVGPGRGGMRWIYVGTAITTVVLLAVAVWNSITLAAVATPPGKTSLTVRVTAHQWWWEVTYPEGQGAGLVTTANELHIPVGEAVKVELASPDVIHSFWVPQLAGKTDAIPGQTNYAWLQADRPGRYRGQCAEYCGAQHAHMALYVVAEVRPRFEAWRRLQAAGARAPGTPLAQRGRVVFENRCALCHTVRGDNYPPGGRRGPDLTHLMGRATIAGGMLENNAGNLYGWIGNPQALKPGTRMPVLGLEAHELHAAVAYLRTLQ